MGNSWEKALVSQISSNELDAHFDALCQDWPDSCNLNLYESGDHSVGWHSDDEFLFQGTSSLAGQLMLIRSTGLGETVIPVPYFAARILGQLPIFADSIFILSSIFE